MFTGCRAILLSVSGEACYARVNTDAVTDDAFAGENDSRSGNRFRSEKCFLNTSIYYGYRNSMHARLILMRHCRKPGAPFSGSTLRLVLPMPVNMGLCANFASPLKSSAITCRSSLRARAQKSLPWGTEADGRSCRETLKVRAFYREAAAPQRCLPEKMFTGRDKWSDCRDGGAAPLARSWRTC